MTAGRVLICGGAGFIGTNLAARLLDAGERSRVVLAQQLLELTNEGRLSRERLACHDENTGALRGQRTDQMLLHARRAVKEPLQVCMWHPHSEKGRCIAASDELVSVRH